jgi:hypothetical protein
MVNELLPWLKANRVAAGDGLTESQTHNGKVIAGTITYEDHPWKLYQKEDDNPGLIVNMTPGLVSGVAAISGNPANIIVTLSPLTVTDDATTLVWV